MHEEIVDFVRKSTGVSSEELAREFFKMKNPDPHLSHRMLDGVLGGDRRCFFGDDGLWHASPVKASEAALQAVQDLRALPWHAVHVLLNPTGGGKKVFQWPSPNSITTIDNFFPIISNFESYG